MQNKIKISIITSTWNCEETIEDCLASVANQTYPNTEHILIDGASTDGTLALLEKHKGRLSYLLSEPDTGIYDALNKGIALASGDVVGFLHADDFFSNDEVLSKVAAIFEADETLSAVYGDLDYVSRGDANRIIRHWQSEHFESHKLSLGWMPPHPTLYVRRQWYSKIGGFEMRYKISADYFSIVQLFGHDDFKSYYHPEVMVKMRLGGVSNRSISAIVRKSLEDWNVLKRSGFGFCWRVIALMFKNLGKVKQYF